MKKKILEALDTDNYQESLQQESKSSILCHHCQAPTLKYKQGSSQQTIIYFLKDANNSNSDRMKQPVSQSEVHMA